jgi:hypothetical protein
MMVFGETLASVSDMEALKSWTKGTHLPGFVAPPHMCPSGYVFTDIPTYGLREYNIHDYISGSISSPIFKGVPVTMYSVQLNTTISGFLLKNIDSSWTISGDTVESIFEIFASLFEDSSNVDMIQYEKINMFLGLLLEALGCRRSCALAWKLEFHKDLVPTQIYENATFTILCGMFPGFIKRKNGVFTVLKQDILSCIIVRACMDMGFLPSTPQCGIDSFKNDSDNLGRAVRNYANTVVGNHRWLNLDPVTCGRYDESSEKTAALALGKMRGLKITERNVIYVGKMNPEDLLKHITPRIIYIAGPLVVVFSAKNITEEMYEIMRKYLFPYASVILNVGSLHETSILGKLYTFCQNDIEGYRPYAVKYVRSEFTFPLKSSKNTIIITSSNMISTFVNKSSITFFSYTSSSPKETSTLIINIDDIKGDPTDINSIYKTMISKSTTVLVYYTSRWQLAMPLINHNIRDNFVINIYI